MGGRTRKLRNRARREGTVGQVTAPVAPPSAPKSKVNIPKNRFFNNPKKPFTKS